MRKTLKILLDGRERRLKNVLEELLRESTLEKYGVPQELEELPSLL